MAAYERLAMPDWKDDLSPRERVRQIVETVTDPVSANWVAEQADVGWQTAKDELDQLAERGDLRRVDQGDDVRYVPDFTRLYTERIRELALSFSREELREEIVQDIDQMDQIQGENVASANGEFAAVDLDAPEENYFTIGGAVAPMNEVARAAESPIGTLGDINE